MDMSNDYDDKQNSSDQFAVQNVIGVNNLTYKLASDLSCVQARRYTRHHFLNQQYGSANTRATCVLQTGSNFVGTMFLHFTVTVANDTSNTNTSITSGTDLIQSLTIYTRDGTEVSRTNDLNVISRQFVNYKSDQSKMFGPNSTFRPPAPVSFATPTQEFYIPMGVLSGLMSIPEDGGRLLPSALMAGLRLEFVFAPAEIALVTTAGNVTYTIDDIYIDCLEYTLNDAIALSINDECAKNGLEIPFVEYFTTRYSNVLDDVNIEVRKAASRALAVAVIPQLNHSNANVDSCGAEQDFPFQQIQARLGSIYFPNQRLTSQTAIYRHCLENFERLYPSSAGTSVSLTAFLEQGQGIYMQSLERSNVLDLAGMSSNNSRTVAISARMRPAESNARSLLCVLSYLRVVTVYLNNTVLQE